MAWGRGRSQLPAGWSGQTVVSLVLSTVAVAVASLAALYSKRQSEATTRQASAAEGVRAIEELRDQGDRRKQAELVAAWLERVERTSWAEGSLHGVDLVVSNRSSSPVYDVVVVHTGHRADDLRWGLIPPGKEIRVPSDIGLLGQYDASEAGAISLTFTDVREQRWTRRGAKLSLEPG